MIIDFYLFHLINGLAGRLPPLDYLGIFLAVYLPYFLVLSALVFLIQERSWRRRLYFIGLGALSLILSRGVATEIIRFFYSRPRPFDLLGFNPLTAESSGRSFPSGHAAFFFALAWAVFYFLGSSRWERKIIRRWNLWFFGGAILIGIGRVFAGVHWPSDIVAGAIIGYFSVFITRELLPSPPPPESKLSAAANENNRYP